MSSRPRVSAKTTPQAPVDRLSCVLSTGMNMSTSIDKELTDAEFEFEVDRIIAEEGIVGKTATDLKKQTLQLVKDTGEYVVDGGKDAAHTAVKKTKGLAKRTTLEAKKKLSVAGLKAQKRWAGAKYPSSWALETDKYAAARIKESYKMYIGKQGWENIQDAYDPKKEENAFRCIYAETGLNLHAQIAIRKDGINVVVINSINSKQSVDGYETFGTLDVDFKDLVKNIDTKIDNLTKMFYEKFNPPQNAEQNAEGMEFNLASRDD